MTFNIGQIFEGGYPPEVAVWCNESGNVYIEELDSVDGLRRFQIVKAPEPTDVDIEKQVRAERDRLITETDYYLMPDYPSNPQNLEELKVYRQALRDLPVQEGFPRNVRWPAVPKFLRKDSETESLGLAKVGV